MNQKQTLAAVEAMLFACGAVHRVCPRSHRLRLQRFIRKSRRHLRRDNADQILLHVHFQYAVLCQQAYPLRRGQGLRRCLRCSTFHGRCSLLRCALRAAPCRSRQHNSDHQRDI